MNSFSRRNLLIGLSTVCMIACGGGSSSSNSTPPPPVQQLPTGIIADSEEGIIAQPLELALFFPSDTLTNIKWQQSSGAPLTLHADNTKMISITPTSSGDYQIDVSFIRNGVSEQLSHQFSVTQQQAQLATWLGHAALEGSKVSLRTYFNNPQISLASTKWQQVSGPNINFSESNDGKSAIFFTAPEVNQDSIIKFNVSASDNSQTYQDSVSILVEAASDIADHSNIAYEDRLARVFPYNSNSPYADVLADCVYSNQIDFRETCRFNQLPLIAQDSSNPSIDDIMDRVLVSHQWMGDRFKEFLENSDPHIDFRRLLRATTAVVISYDIRPSYYWVVTGAIHLDPNYLWQTPEERDTINQAPDFRTAFGASLQFEMPWRYVKNNNYASFSVPQSTRVSRSAAAGEHSLAALMYHELAHANDFFPASIWSQLEPSERILDAASEILNGTGIQSDILAEQLPLTGQQMYSLAQVRFHGEEANSTEQNYRPADIANFFSPEHAPQFYSYSSKREDLAILFDGFMMKARYDVDRDVAVTNNPQSVAEEYIVTWGQRGRIGEEHIKPRVSFVSSRILPEFTNASNIIENLATPIPMQPGLSWADNLAISPSTAKAERQAEDSLTEQLQPLEGISFYEKRLPQRQ